MNRASFTLIELLIVIAIIAALAVVVVISLNPSQLLKQARDSTRLSDLDTINHAMSLVQVDQPSVFLGNASSVYVSVPDLTLAAGATSTCDSLNLPPLPAGLSYYCVSSSSLRNIDGTGWIPVNFKQISAGPPFAKLPIDPKNSTSSGSFYRYISRGDKWESMSMLESNKYGIGGEGDKSSADGGADPYLFEKGSAGNLTPSSELLVNPIFATGDMTGWNHWSGGVSGLVTSPLHWSKYSLITQGSNSYCNNYYAQDLPVKQNTTYSIGAWAKTINEVGNAYVGIADTSWGSWVSGPGITGTTDWTYLKISANSGSNTMLRFWVSVGWCGGPSPGFGPSGTSYFADISVVEGEALSNGPR